MEILHFAIPEISVIHWKQAVFYARLDYIFKSSNKKPFDVHFHRNPTTASRSLHLSNYFHVYFLILVPEDLFDEIAQENLVETYKPQQGSKIYAVCGMHVCGNKIYWKYNHGDFS